MLPSQDNNIAKAEVGMTSFPRRGYEVPRMLAIILRPSNQIPNISLFKGLDTKWNWLAQAEHFDPTDYHSTFLFQTNNFYLSMCRCRAWYTVKNNVEMLSSSLVKSVWLKLDYESITFSWLEKLIQQPLIRLLLKCL